MKYGDKKYKHEGRLQVSYLSVVSGLFPEAFPTGRSWAVISTEAQAKALRDHASNVSLTAFPERIYGTTIVIHTQEVHSMHRFHSNPHWRALRTTAWHRIVTTAIPHTCQDNDGSFGERIRATRIVGRRQGDILKGAWIRHDSGT